MCDLTTTIFEERFTLINNYFTIFITGPFQIGNNNCFTHNLFPNELILNSIENYHIKNLNNDQDRQSRDKHIY
jgi:hypothetical protein